MTTYVSLLEQLDKVNMLGGFVWIELPPADNQEIVLQIKHFPKFTSLQT